MPTVFLVRHGESQSNVGLPTDCPECAKLTVRGKEQAKRIAFSLESLTSLDLIVTSSYQRSKETAMPTQDAFPTVSQDEWKVQEFTYLSPVYLGYSNAEQRKPLVEAYWEQLLPFYEDGPGAESFAQFIERVQAFLNLLRDQEYEDKTIAVFSHEQFIKAVLWLIDDGPIEMSSKAMRDFRDCLNHKSLRNGAIVNMRYSHYNNCWCYERITQHLDLEYHVLEAAAAKCFHLKHFESESNSPLLPSCNEPQKLDRKEIKISSVLTAICRKIEPYFTSSVP